MILRWSDALVVRLTSTVNSSDCRQPAAGLASRVLRRLPIDKSSGIFGTNCFLSRARLKQLFEFFEEIVTVVRIRIGNVIEEFVIPG